MAESFDIRLIPEFDGTGTQTITEWLEKLEIVCQLRGVEAVENVIPLRLSGGAFAVYQQIGLEDRKHVGKVKEALLTAFAVDAFAAYEQFTARRLKPGESVDVFLADLRRLAKLFGGLSETGLACAFIVGLPDSVRQLLRAGSRMESLSLTQLLTRARAVLADEEVAVVNLAKLKSPGPSVKRDISCFECGMPNHLARDCFVRRRRQGDQGRREPAEARRCFRCGEIGHLAARCTGEPAEATRRCYRCGDTTHVAARCPGNATGEETAPVSSPARQ